MHDNQVFSTPQLTKAFWKINLLIIKISIRKKSFCRYCRKNFLLHFIYLSQNKPVQEIHMDEYCSILKLPF